MLIEEFVSEFCLQEACQNRRLLNRFLNASTDLVYVAEDPSMTDVGLREETREGAKERNFIRFRRRTMFGSANTVFP